MLKWRVTLITLACLLIVGGVGIAAWYGMDFSKQRALVTPVGGVPAVSSQGPPRQTGATDGATATPLWKSLPEPGSRLGTLVFPQLHFSVPVVQGTHWDQLKLGVGHYMSSDLPGQGGNVFLSGHRDTVFAPLRFLKMGDDIVFRTPHGEFQYKATRIRIVPENEGDVVVPTTYETLTLSTCYPFFYIGFAPKRFVVYTTLVSEPKIHISQTQ